MHTDVPHREYHLSQDPKLIKNLEQQPEVTRNINPPAIPSQVSAFTADVAQQQ